MYCNCIDWLIENSNNIFPVKTGQLTTFIDNRFGSSEPCEQLLAKVYFWGFIFTIDQVQCSRSFQNVKVTPECLWKQKWGFGFPRRIEEVRVIKKTKQQILNLTPPPPCWHLRRSSVHVSGLATVSSIWPMKSHSHVISV